MSGLFSVYVDHARWNANMNMILLRGMPEVISETLNTQAHLAGIRQLQNLKKDFTLRNQYTEGSLRIGKESGTRGLYWPALATVPINRMNAVIGSKSPYLPIQEEGGQKQKAGSMPTLAGRGGDEKAVIPSYFRLRAMGSIGGGKGSFTRGGKRRRGKGFFILGPGPTLKQPAIFFRELDHPGAPLMKIRLLGKKTQTVKPTHWHTEAVRYYGTWKSFNQTFERTVQANREMRQYLKENNLTE
jgi:hypothetical protein